MGDFAIILISCEWKAEPQYCISDFSQEGEGFSVDCSRWILDITRQCCIANMIASYVTVLVTENYLYVIKFIGIHCLQPETVHTSTLDFLSCGNLFYRP